MPIISDYHIRHDEDLFPAGEVITLPADTEKKLVVEGLAKYVQHIEVKTSAHDESEQSEMSIAELQEYLKTAEYIDDVEAALEKEKARKDPRKTAIKLLEEWLKEAESDEQL